MRGKDAAEVYAVFSVRITPAYAGKRSKLHLRGSSPEDHPRLCGEKRCRTQFRQELQGSPPPMRGKDAEAFAVADFFGITPAYAGKRTFLSSWVS